MFRRLIMVIFRLYMKYLLSSYTKHTWAVYMGEGGDKGGTKARFCQKGWAVWVSLGGGGVSMLTFQDAAVKPSHKYTPFGKVKQGNIREINYDHNTSHMPCVN